MWNNKMKAVTLSYDDGVVQDKRLCEILNKYNLKCTFNICSGRMYNEFSVKNNCVKDRMTADECIDCFKGHEIAVHTLTHTNLKLIDDTQLEYQIMGDKVNLERIFKTDIYGMAYPGGQYNERVKTMVKNCGIKYSRTTQETEKFDICDDLLELSTTCHHNNKKLFKLAENFLKMECEKPQLFYLWGHSYEFDIDNSWKRFEEFCEIISGNMDVFYCTNHEALSPFYK